MKRQIKIVTEVMDQKLKSLSKFLSYLLRHNPSQLGLAPDEHGWVNTEELIARVNQSGTEMDRTLLQEIVRTNDKQRFAFNHDQTLIRANQGHSISVDLDLEEKQPPLFLYHGTTSAALPSILESGLQKQARHHVHLSENVDTANAVGSRHGKAVVLIVMADEMHKAGYKFFRTANGVWLTDNVPPDFLSLM